MPRSKINIIKVITVAHKRGYQVVVICISSELTKTREAE